MQWAISNSAVVGSSLQPVSSLPSGLLYGDPAQHHRIAGSSGAVAAAAAAVASAASNSTTNSSSSSDRSSYSSMNSASALARLFATLVREVSNVCVSYVG